MSGCPGARIVGARASDLTARAIPLPAQSDRA